MCWNNSTTEITIIISTQHITGTLPYYMCMCSKIEVWEYREYVYRPEAGSLSHQDPYTRKIFRIFFSQNLIFITELFYSRTINPQSWCVTSQYRKQNNLLNLNLPYRSARLYRLASTCPKPPVHTAHVRAHMYGLGLLVHARELTST